MIFTRDEYAVFREYRMNNNKKYNWLIFMNHWLGGSDYYYNNAREEILRDSGYKWHLKRALFGLLVIFIMVFAFLIYANV